MDLIADMLMDALPHVAGSPIAATRLCPSMVPRWSRLPLVGGAERARLVDRLTGRLWDYPRWLAPHARDFDLFHIVDHSYAHLLRVLPAERTIGLKWRNFDDSSTLLSTMLSFAKSHSWKTRGHPRLG